MSSNGVGPGVPPLRAFGAGFVQLPGAVGERETRVQGHSLTCDDRPRPVIYLSIGFVLRETQMNQRPKKIAGLRLAAVNDPRNVPAYRIGRTFIILCCRSKKGGDVA